MTIYSPQDKPLDTAWVCIFLHSANLDYLAAICLVKEHTDMLIVTSCDNGKRCVSDAARVHHIDSEAMDSQVLVTQD